MAETLCDLDPTAKAAATALGCGIDDMRKLAACGVIASNPRGRSTRYDGERVNEIAGWPELDRSAPRAIAVRMGEPSEARPSRDWSRTHTGWHQAWDDNTKREAVRGWWRIAEEFRAPGTALVVLVGVVVVAVYDVTGTDTPADLVGGVTRLTIADPTPDQQNQFAGRRLRLGRGALTVASTGWPARK